MVSAAIDTSGAVWIPPAGGPEDYDLAAVWGRYTWPDLSPLEQAYVEAALRELAERLDKMFEPHTRSFGSDFARFDKLAPSTLVAMLKDCEAWLHERDEHYGAERRDWRTAEKGADFWGSRNGGAWTNFPPLTLTLADDELIYQDAA